MVHVAGITDLFNTLDAVNQEVANVWEMLTAKRPDLVEDMALGGDLLILSSLRIVPKFRGNRLDHAVLKAILGTVGRSAAMVILEAAPVLTARARDEGGPGMNPPRPPYGSTGRASASRRRPVTTADVGR